MDQPERQRTAFDLLMENPDWVQDPVTFAFRPRREGETQNPVLVEQMQAEAKKRGLVWESPDAKATTKGRDRPMDISAGEYEDFFAISKSVLRELGVLGRDPTDDEIVFFAKAGMNAESVLEHYANAPEIIEKQPGVPYGLSLREYEQRTRELAQGFESVFRGQKAPSLPGPRTSKAERESSLFGSALRNRVSQQEFTSTLATFQQERGRAPSQAEFEERRNRPSYRAKQPRLEAPGTETRQLSGGVTSPRPARRK